MGDFIKKLSVLFVGALFLSVLVLVSCKFGVKDHDEKGGYDTTRIDYEMSKLANEAELDFLITRGDDNIVDWQLSKEFAQVWLEESVEAGEYPIDSELYEIPVPIYDSDGNVKFYEFRVVSEGKFIASITGAATKDYDCPILYQSLCEGYSEKLESLYENGIISEDSLPRLVDNGYPHVVFGVINETRGTGIEGFDEFIDITTEENIEKEEITSVLTYEEVLAQYPELMLDEIDNEKMLALIENYKKNGQAFWEFAVTKKGHIGDFATRGGGKTERTELDWNYVEKTFTDHWNDEEKRYYKGIGNYRACGAVASGFVLDYLTKNNIQPNIPNITNWSSLSPQEKKASLYRLMHIGEGFVADVVDWVGEDGGSVTMPHNLGNAIEYYSDYELSLSLYNYPKTAINNNLPGISLRTFGKGGMHYRAVIAYKVNGWWAFSWPSFKIIDLVDCNISERSTGKWETYIPIHHIMNWNVVKK